MAENKDNEQNKNEQYNPLPSDHDKAVTLGVSDGKIEEVKKDEILGEKEGDEDKEEKFKDEKKEYEDEKTVVNPIPLKPTYDVKPGRSWLRSAGIYLTIATAGAGILELYHRNTQEEPSNEIHELKSQLQTVQGEKKTLESHLKESYKEVLQLCDEQGVDTTSEKYQKLVQQYLQTTSMSPEYVQALDQQSIDAKHIIWSILEMEEFYSNEGTPAYAQPFTQVTNKDKKPYFLGSHIIKAKKIDATYEDFQKYMRNRKRSRERYFNADHILQFLEQDVSSGDSVLAIELHKKGVAMDEAVTQTCSLMKEEVPFGYCRTNIRAGKDYTSIIAEYKESQSED